MKVRHREKLAEVKQVYLREMMWRDQKIKEQEREMDFLTKRLKKVNWWLLMIKYIRTGAGGVRKYHYKWELVFLTRRTTWWKW